jgi:hypothetical protein
MDEMQPVLGSKATVISDALRSIFRIGSKSGATRTVARRTIVPRFFRKAPRSTAPVHAARPSGQGRYVAPTHAAPRSSHAASHAAPHPTHAAPQQTQIAPPASGRVFHKLGDVRAAKIEELSNPNLRRRSEVDWLEQQERALEVKENSRSATSMGIMNVLQSVGMLTAIPAIASVFNFGSEDYSRETNKAIKEYREKNVLTQIEQLKELGLDDTTARNVAISQVYNLPRSNALNQAYSGYGPIYDQIMASGKGPVIPEEPIPELAIPAALPIEQQPIYTQPTSGMVYQ